MNNYLLDEQFLKQLDYQQNRETYIRIIALSNDDLPREEIIGRATGGSINIEGASAVTRSCNLSLAVSETDKIVTDSYWCYNNKFKLEIGLKNSIQPKYPDIVWFEMGIYIITGFNKSKTTNNLSISLSGKDKMCRLNGEVSGNLAMSTDFGTIEDIEYIEEKDPDTGDIINTTTKTTITKLKIYEIICNALKEYGQERAENIIINDLDQYGYELQEYRGDKPIYFFIEKNNDNQSSVINMTIDEKTEIFYNNQSTTIENFSGKFYSMNTIDTDYNNTASQITFSANSEDKYYIAKIEYGETAGYCQIPLVYNNDLILNAGETVTSLLDKLTAMLGDFEYFYDLQGRFIFQKKKTYIQELFSPINGNIISPTAYISQYGYKFEDEKLFTAISDSPNINNLKNDYSIWGQRNSLAGSELPIHARYAIDKKPKKYHSLDWYEKDEDGNLQLKEEGQEFTAENYDWRELIYRMAIDFYRHNQENDYLIRLEENNPQFINGKTGYEQYYSDLQYYWRQLYNPNPTEYDKKQYGEFYDELGTDGNGNDAYWNKKIHLDPSTLNFWFDFLDTEGELNKFSIKHYDYEKEQFKTNIGTRTKVINESSIKSIYYKETPEVLFIKQGQEIDSTMSYMRIQIQKNMEDLFYKSGQGVSAIQRANELIYQHAAIIEGIQITSIPIYYLQCNTRIYVKDQGDYILNKINYSLAYNGTMSLSGNKIIKQFY